MVNLVSVYSDGAYRAGGTEILASSATDAFLFLNRGDHDSLAVFPDFLNHLDGSDRAVAGAVAALIDFTVINEAEPRGDAGCSDFPLGLLLGSDFQYRSGGAYFRTFDTLGAAIASLE